MRQIFQGGEGTPFYADSLVVHPPKQKLQKGTKKSLKKEKKNEDEEKKLYFFFQIPRIPPLPPCLIAYIASCYINFSKYSIS